MLETIFHVISARLGTPPLDPRADSRDLLELVWDLAWKFFRGNLRKPFTCCKGLLLLGRRVVVRSGHRLHSVGPLVVEDYAEIQALARQGLHFGKKVTIGRFAQIRPSGYYGREMGEGLIVGDFSNIGPECFIGCGGLIRIGARVMMGAKVHMHAEAHVTENPSKPMQEQGIRRSGIIIGDDCWLGAGCVILDGVELGKGCVVGAGTVVTKSFSENSVIAGVPARLLRLRKAESL